MSVIFIAFSSFLLFFFALQAKKNNKGFNIRDLRMSSIFVPACRYFGLRPK